MVVVVILVALFLILLVIVIFDQRIKRIGNRRTGKIINQTNSIILNTKTNQL